MNKIGCQCKKCGGTLELQVLESAEGFYIGICCPTCNGTASAPERLSKYYKKAEDAEANMLNEYQLIAVSGYNGGGLAQHMTLDSVRKCGDPLLEFIVSELSAEHDCDSIEIAIRRVDTAINDLMGVLEALHMAREGVACPN